MAGKDSCIINYLPGLDNAIQPLEIKKPRRAYTYNYLGKWKQRTDGQLVLEHATPSLEIKEPKKAYKHLYENMEMETEDRWTVSKAHSPVKWAPVASEHGTQ